jgi:peptidoglycan/LPS O-acetylase OafA/YrhL
MGAGNSPVDPRSRRAILYIVVFHRRGAAKTLVGADHTGINFDRPLFPHMECFDRTSLLSTLLPGAFDFLAAGALLAYAEVENLWLTIRRTAASPLVTIAAFLVLALSSMIRQIYEWRIISSSATIILTASVILSVSMVEKNKLLDWLAWTPIRYCGRISYGIYVYHFFVPMLILLVFPNFGTILMVSRGGGIVRFAFLSVVTLLIAHFSWILVERPLLSLRDKQWKIGHNEREKIRTSTPT